MKTIERHKTKKSRSGQTHLLEMTIKPKIRRVAQSEFCDEVSPVARSQSGRQVEKRVENVGTRTLVLLVSGYREAGGSGGSGGDVGYPR